MRRVASALPAPTVRESHLSPIFLRMPRAADAIIVCSIALLCIGLVMVSSADMNVRAPGDPGITLHSVLFSRTAGLMVVSLLVMTIVARLPIQRVLSSPRRSRWIPLLWPVVIVALLLVYIPGIGHEVNGSARWILIPGFTAQPSEFAKWALVLIVAWYASTFASRLHDFVRGVLPALVLIGVPTVLIAVEDLGTGVLVAGVGTLLLLAAGAKLWHFLAMTPLIALALVGAIITSPYRIRRLVAFIDPYKDPADTGYHIIQSLVAIANGEGFGRGLGAGLQKFGYLPEDRTDFLFAVLCEELGIAGAALVVALYSALLIAAYRIAVRQQHLLMKLTALGVTFTIGAQAIINLTVVTGLAPTKGIALPLLSSGGTGWILTAGAMGLLIAIGRSQPERIETELSDDASSAAARRVIEPKPMTDDQPTAQPVAV